MRQNMPGNMPGPTLGWNPPGQQNQQPHPSPLPHNPPQQHFYQNPPQQQYQHQQQYGQNPPQQQYYSNAPNQYSTPATMPPYTNLQQQPYNPPTGPTQEERIRQA